MVTMKILKQHQLQRNLPLLRLSTILFLFFPLEAFSLQTPLLSSTNRNFKISKSLFGRRPNSRAAIKISENWRTWSLFSVDANSNILVDDSVNRKSHPSLSQSKTSHDKVEEILRQIQVAESSLSSEDEVTSAKSSLHNLIQQLEDANDEPYINKNQSNSTNENDLKKFEPLLGLYDVSFTQTVGERDNPVGGKWTRKNGLAQKLFTTRRTFQHLLPTNSTGLCASSSALSARIRSSYLSQRKKGVKKSDNTELDMKTEAPTVVAEAINVISLDAFFKLIRITIVLRGDAVPLTLAERKYQEQLNDEKNRGKIVGSLSELAVRAYFDPPRIVLGKRGSIFNFSLGPPSSVVLDSPYVDSRIRVGKGGTSGTRFIFRRCLDEGNEGIKEANEFRGLLKYKPVRKSKIVSVLAALSGFGLYSVFGRAETKVFGRAFSVLTSLLCMAVLISSGGIEKDNNRN